MQRGFWDDLKKPIIGLSPMDGVTDAAYRYIMDKYGHPSILVTEFTPVEALNRDVVRALEMFIYHKTETPNIAQIYGTELDSYYTSALLVAEMGFDGLDINMGCPDKSVSGRGAGAGLILQPKLAQEIVKTCKKALDDWNNGMTLEKAGVKVRMRDFISAFKERSGISVEKRFIPVSVKTRVGFDKPVIHEWISNLLEVEPVNITLHGRTLKQMYTGLADWDEIAKAAELAHKTQTTLIGNGDIQSIDEALEKVKKYGVDGVLIGRATYGNPWVFTGEKVTPETKLKVALEHCEAFMRLTPDHHFASLRKHLVWYAKAFENATDLRAKLVRAENLDQVREIVTEQLQK